MEGGLNLEESVQVAARLEKAGIDYLHLYSGCYQAFKWVYPDHEGALLAEAQSSEAVLSIPVICSMIYDPHTAEKATQEGAIDIASLFRVSLNFCYT